MEKSSLAGIDANLLVALDALVAEENVGRAARRVGLSSSAMSHALARLRDRFGDPLLVRSGPRMVASPRARELAPKLREGLSLVEAAIARPRPFDLAAQRRSLRVAAVDFAQNHLVLALVERLRREAPGVDVVVQPFGSGAFADLAAGEVDVGLAAHRPMKGVLSRTVMEEPFVCVLRRGHPALGSKLTAARYAALDHVLISPRGRVQGASDLALKKLGRRRRVALVTPTFLAAALAVVESDLVLTCAERSARQAADWLGLQIVAPPVRLAKFRLEMFWHARTEGDPFHALVRDRLAALALA